MRAETPSFHLADRVGRDYSTVSRQVSKVKSLGLARRQGGAEDRRVREAIVTPRGKVMTDAVDAAREWLGRVTRAKWEERDFEGLARLLRKFATDIGGQDSRNR